MGQQSFRDLCVDFGLLACARSVYCDLNRLLGAYCIVQYYPKKQQMPEDKIAEVMSVVSNRDRENNWDHLQFAEPFARIAVAEEKEESTIPLAKYVDDIEENILVLRQSSMAAPEHSVYLSKESAGTSDAQTSGT